MNGHLALPKKPANHFSPRVTGPDAGLCPQMTADSHRSSFKELCKKSRPCCSVRSSYFFIHSGNKHTLVVEEQQGQGTTKSHKKQLKHINDLSSASIVSTCAGKTKRCQLSQRFEFNFQIVLKGVIVFDNTTRC